LGKITLADSSSGMLEVLQEKISAGDVKNMTPLLLDLGNDPLPNRRFHLIYSLMTLHHIPDTAGILEKFQALLVPGGILCIADLDKEDGTFHEQDHGEHHGFDRTELTELMTRAGFEKIHFTTPYTMQKGSKTYPLFLAVGEKS
jgi:ubiquinone/menaquinone biosynthesis C-methylase UbiE